MIVSSYPIRIIHAIRAIPGRIATVVAWLILHVGVAGSGRAYGPLSFWFVWQSITGRYYRAVPVRSGSFLKFCIATHRKPAITLADGTVVERGDRVASLHIDNGVLARRLAKAEGTMTTWTWIAAKGVLGDLTALAEPGKLDPQVKAIRGVSLLAPGAKRLGFELRPIKKSRWNDLVRFFMLGLLIIYSVDGRRRLASVERDAYPGEVWMSRRMLLERFGKQDESA